MGGEGRGADNEPFFQQISTVLLVEVGEGWEGEARGGG